MRLLAVVFSCVLVLAGCQTTGHGERTPLKGKAETAFQNYLTNSDFKDFKAFLYEPSGAWSLSLDALSPEEAIEIAQKRCRKRNNGKDCKVYALGNEVLQNSAIATLAVAKRNYRYQVSSSAFTDFRKGATQLEPSDIRHFLIGKKMKGQTVGGREFKLGVYRSGILEVSLLGMKTVKQRYDLGRWSVEGKQVCFEGGYLWGAKKSCFEVFGKQDQFGFSVGNDGVGFLLKVEADLATTGLIKQQLTTREIEKLVIKQKFAGKSGADQDVVLNYAKNSKGNQLYLQRKDDEGNIYTQSRGSWWVINDRVCQKLRGFNRAGVSCFRVSKNADQIVFIGSEGDLRYALKPDGKVNLASLQKGNKSSLRKNGKLKRDTEKLYYNIGTHVGYNTLCATYVGVFADPEVVRKVHNAYKRHPSYMKGYDRYDRMAGHDRVTGLTQCEMVKTNLINIAKKL